MRIAIFNTTEVLSLKESFGDTIKGISHTKLREMVDKFSDSTLERVDNFNKSMPSDEALKELKEFPPKLLKELEDIERAIKVINEKKNCGSDSTSLRRADAIIGQISKGFYAFYNEIFKIKYLHKGTPKLDSSELEKDLSRQQQFVNDSKEINGAFFLALNKINQSKKDRILTSVIVITAEVSDDSHQGVSKHGYLQWVPDFLDTLKKHLNESGVENITIMSPKNPELRAYSDYDEFMRKKLLNADTHKIVLIVGTEALLDRHEKGGGPHCVSTQLVYLRRLMNQSAKDAKKEPQIIPLLLSGDVDTSFPAEYRGYKCITFNDGSYVNGFRKLVNIIHQVNNNVHQQQMDNIWNQFLGTKLISGVLIGETISRRDTLEKFSIEKAEQNERSEERRDQAAKALFRLTYPSVEAKNDGGGSVNSATLFAHPPGTSSAIPNTINPLEKTLQHT